MTKRSVVMLTALAVSGAFAHAQTQAAATIHGIAYDSLRGVPLRGAFVMIAGSARNAVTDQSGAFHFDTLPPGPYTFVMQHAALDSLGLGERTTRVMVAGAADTIRLAVPSFATIWSRLCAGAPPTDSAIVFGGVRSVRQRGPLAGATVGVSWIDVTVTKDSGIVRRRIGGDVHSDATGAYAACGVPLTLGVMVVATSDSSLETLIELAPSDARIRRLDLLLGAPGAAHGTIVGTVHDALGGGVAGARIQTSGLPEMRTDASGRFVVRDVSAGSRQLDVLVIGMVPASATVDVSPADTAFVDIQVEKVTALDTMRVTGMTPYKYRARDIADRMKLGDGHFMDSTVIERHADVKSAVSELPRSSCLSTLWIDGARIRDRREIPDELRLLKPEEIGVFEWYERSTPPQFGRGGCTLVIWTRRALP